MLAILRPGNGHLRPHRNLRGGGLGNDLRPPLVLDYVGTALCCGVGSQLLLLCRSRFGVFVRQGPDELGSWKTSLSRPGQANACPGNGLGIL